MLSEREVAMLSSANWESTDRALGQGGTYMKAIAVFPGKPNTVHLARCPNHRWRRSPNGRGVLVKVLRVGRGRDRQGDQCGRVWGRPGRV